MLNDYVPSLKQARLTHEAAKDLEAKLREALLDNAEYQQAKESLLLAEADLAEWDGKVREAALEAYAADPSTKKVHPKVSITIRRNVVVGEAKKVLTWVKTHLPTAIKIDTTKLKQHARAVQATQPIPEHVAKIEEAPSVRIAKAL